MPQSLINAVPLGLFELDEAGTVVYYHPDGDAAPGEKAEGLVGRNFFEDVAPVACARGFRNRVDDFRRAHAASQGFDYSFADVDGDRAVRVLLARVREGGYGDGKETVMIHIRAN